MLRRGMPFSRPAAFALCVQATAPLSPPTPTSTDLPQPVPTRTGQHQTVPANMSQHPSTCVSAVGLFARSRPLPSRPALFLRRAAAVFPALPPHICRCYMPLYPAAHCRALLHTATRGPLLPAPIAPSSRPRPPPTLRAPPSLASPCVPTRRRGKTTAFPL